MKGFAVSLIMAAFAIGSGSSFDRLINEVPRYVVELKNNEGSNVGKLGYHVDGNYEAYIYGAIPGLEPGIYYVLSYEDQNFNGTCASADPFSESNSSRQSREAFTPVNIAAPFYSVKSYVQGVYLGCDIKKQPHGLLAYVYLVPTDVGPGDYATRRKPAPAACGYIKLRTPCQD